MSITVIETPGAGMVTENAEVGELGENVEDGEIWAATAA